MARKALGPASLAVVRAVEQAIRALPTPPQALVVGCSGGADSTALALAMAELDRRKALPAGWLVRVVDHGLQSSSELVAAQVIERMSARGLPVEARVVDVQLAGQGLEAAAREARLAALRAPLEGVDPLVLLGHTLDDQAETVLLGLARGSGPVSLSGMAPVADGLVRPLLGLRRHTTRQACAEWGVEVWDDPHNDEPRFARVRVRQRVMPVLEDELGPGIAPALARTATLLREDHELLDELASVELGHCRAGDGLDCGALAALTRPLRTRVLRQWLAAVGLTQLSHERTLAVEALVTHWRGQGPIELPGGLAIDRDRGLLQLRRVHG